MVPPLVAPFIRNVEKVLCKDRLNASRRQEAMLLLVGRRWRRHLRALGPSGLILREGTAEAFHLTCSFSTRTNSHCDRLKNGRHLLWFAYDQVELAGKLLHQQYRSD